MFMYGQINWEKMHLVLNQMNHETPLHSVYTGSEDCCDTSEIEAGINLHSMTHCITLHPV